MQRNYADKSVQHDQPEKKAPARAASQARPPVPQPAPSPVATPAKPAKDETEDEPPSVAVAVCPKCGSRDGAINFGSFVLNGCRYCNPNYPYAAPVRAAAR
jgi:hypothetical protein